MNIRQIAFLAGVSSATVSRCINQPEKVSEETRDRINAVMIKMDYTPNPTAKSLSTGCTRTIMCMVPTLCNEFFNQVVEGIQKILGQAHYKLLVYSVNDSADLWQGVNQRSIDGMIISGSGLLNSGHLELDRIHVPYVLIENMKHCEYPTSYVYSDDCRGVNLVLDYLYREGNRTFGVISTADDYPVTKRRLNEVLRFMEEHQGATLYLEKAEYADMAESYEACRRLMNRADCPTAIFAFNDLLAIAALQSLVHQGIKVPEEVEVFGFDGSPVAQYVNPPLSTVFAPNRKLGERAAELLLEKLTGREEEVSQLFPVELCLRGTTKNLILT